MADEKEKEKPKFICKLCKLDYPSSVQFEEHLWSMLHHKAINNKSESAKHHCNLCMFESFDLNAYGKHLIGEQHKRSLVNRRKRLEEPLQATPKTTSSENETEQGTKKQSCKTRWGPPISSNPGQLDYTNVRYSQSWNTDAVTPPSASNINYGEQFRYNERGNFSYNQSRFRYTSGGQFDPNEEPFGFNHRGRYGFNQEQFKPDHGKRFRLHEQQFTPDHEQFANSQQQIRHDREQFRRNQGQFRNYHGNWQESPNPYAWCNVYPRFGQSNVGSWGNRPHDSFPRSRYSVEGQWEKQQNERSATRETHDKGHPVTDKKTNSGKLKDEASKNRGERKERSPVTAKVRATHFAKGQHKGNEKKEEHRKASPVNGKKQSAQRVKQNLSEKKGEHKGRSPINHKQLLRKGVNQEGVKIKKNEDPKGRSPVNMKNHAKHKGQGEKRKIKPNINVKRKNENVILTMYGPLPDTSQPDERKDMSRSDADRDVPLGHASNEPKVSTTPNKCQKKKLKKKPSPTLKLSANQKQSRTKHNDLISASRYKTNVAEKPKRNQHTDSDKRASTSNPGHEPKDKRAVAKESPSLNQPIQSDVVASTKHSARSELSIEAEKLDPNAASEIDAFGINLQKALSGRLDNTHNEPIMISSSDGVSDNENTFSLVTSTCRTVPVSVNKPDKKEFQGTQSVQHDNPSPPMKQEKKTSTCDEVLGDSGDATSYSAVSPTSTSSKPSLKTSPFKSMDIDFNKMYDELESRHLDTIPSSSDKKTIINHSRSGSSSYLERPSLMVFSHDGTQPISESSTGVTGAQMLSIHSEQEEDGKLSRESHTEKQIMSIHHQDIAARSSANEAANKSSNLEETLKTSEKEAMIDDSSSTGVPALGRSSSAPTSISPALAHSLSAPATTLSASTHLSSDPSGVSIAPASSSSAPTRSTSAPASTATSAPSSSKEPDQGKEPLLTQVLATEQLKQKTNPRPNLNNARTRLRTTKDPEQPSAGQTFKERMQGLLSDVARPVWQQKKLRMILAKAKKSTDRFNRFSHLIKSPSRSEDPLDIMNLSTEFQLELLDLIESEGADKEEFLSQLTGTESGETAELDKQGPFGRSTLDESDISSVRSVEKPPGSIKDAVPSLSQDVQENPSASHTISSSTPIITAPFIKQERSPEDPTPLLKQNQSQGESLSTPCIKKEPLDIADFEHSQSFQPIVRLQRLQLEEHDHPDAGSRKETHSKPHQDSVTSSTHVTRQNSRTSSESDTSESRPSHDRGSRQEPSNLEPLKDVSDGSESYERRDTSTVSKDTNLSVGKNNSTGETKKVSEKNKKNKKSRSPAKGKKSTPPKKTSPCRKSPKVRRKSAQPNLPGSVNRSKSPAVVTANKLKKKMKQKRKSVHPDAIYGDMDSLLEITLEENRLQATMDQLNGKIDQVVRIIQEKEELLKIFKQEKDNVISSLADLRKKRLNLLLGLTSGDNSIPSTSTNQRISSVPPSSGGESDSGRSNNVLRTQATPCHRTEGYRITFGSPYHSEQTQEHGPVETFGDLERRREGVDITSLPTQARLHAGQNIEVVPQVMSRESLAKTLQELESQGGGVKVDILSDDETLYSLNCERLMNEEAGPPSSNVIETVAKLMNPSFMSPDRDGPTSNVGPSTSSRTIEEPHQMSGDSGRRLRHKRVSECDAEETSLGPNTEGAPHRVVASSLNSLQKMKQDLLENLSPSQKQKLSNISNDTTTEQGLSVDCNEQTASKRKRPEGSPVETETKRLKPNPLESSLPKIKQEPKEEIEDTCSASPRMHQSLNTQFPFYSGHSSGNSTSEIPVGAKESSEPRSVQQIKQSVKDTSRSQNKTVSSPRSKGYVISMYIVVDILYACISDSRFIIFNLTTNKIDAEEDLALSEIKYFELWRNTTAGKMVAFASDGSRNLVQFDVKGKEFLQTLVLSKEITCLHVKWNTLFAGTVDGEIANINIQKSKVNWYYDCTPSFAITAIASTLEGGMALVITASEDQTVTIRRADDGLLIRSLWGHHDVVTHIQVLGCYVLSQARDNVILIHNVETGDSIRRVKHQTKMACCVMSEDTLAVAGHAGNIYYYNIKTGKCDIFDSGCGTITCMAASQQMVFLGIRDGFIDVIPLYPSTVYQCEWSHCVSRFLRIDALKTHLQHCHISRSQNQCLWKRCLKNYASKNTTLKMMEEHVFSHLKELENT